MDFGGSENFGPPSPAASHESVCSLLDLTFASAKAGPAAQLDAGLKPVFAAG